MNSNLKNQDSLKDLSRHVLIKFYVDHQPIQFSLWKLKVMSTLTVP